MADLRGGGGRRFRGYIIVQCKYYYMNSLIEFIQVKSRHNILVRKKTKASYHDRARYIRGGGGIGRLRAFVFRTYYPPPPVIPRSASGMYHILIPISETQKMILLPRPEA